MTHSNRVTNDTRNWIASVNWNHQAANSGDVSAYHNTKVWGGGSGSGNAMNSNDASNYVTVNNAGNGSNGGYWGGDSNAAIDTTGPDSFNRIDIRDNNTTRNTTTNNVQSLNTNFQTANSGDVRTSHNTIAEGGSGSGNAYNENSGSNTVSIHNAPSTGGQSMGTVHDASIGTTGPDSYNDIRFVSNNSNTQTTTNNVTSANVNNQSANSGSVSASGNTVVNGMGGSGDAMNVNSGSNHTVVSNN